LIFPKYDYITKINSRANFDFIRLVGNQKIDACNGLLQILGSDLHTLRSLHLLVLHIGVLSHSIYMGRKGSGVG